jgi:hypothetical protein
VCVILSFNLILTAPLITAFEIVGSICGELSAWVPHILRGGTGGSIPPCALATPEAIVMAQEWRAKNQTKKCSQNGTSMETHLVKLQKKEANQSKLITYHGVDMPFPKEQKKEVQAQALRAIILGNLPYTTFKDPKMKKLIYMMCTQAVELLPGPKLASGWLLDNTTNKVEVDLVTRFSGQDMGMLYVQHLSIDVHILRTDLTNPGQMVGEHETRVWSMLSTEIWNTSLILWNVLATSLSKTGESLCSLFLEIIDKVEKKYQCTVMYFITDANGGSLKGRKLLVKERPWLFVPLCMAHQVCFFVVPINS